jgi:hypothetical protein
MERRKSRSITKMDAYRKSQRLKEIAQNLGAVLEIAPLILSPSRAPSLSIPDDERKADAILGQLKLENTASKPSPKGLRRLSSITRLQRSGEQTYAELYRALARVIEENGLAGVVEVLLKRFQNLEGDVNVARKASSGIVKRIRHVDDQGERGKLLETATGLGRPDIVQLLCPHADQVALDSSLGIALHKRDWDIVEILLGYGRAS